LLRLALRMLALRLSLLALLTLALARGLIPLLPSLAALLGLTLLAAILLRPLTALALAATNYGSCWEGGAKLSERAP
jgi:hypothetical protein